VFTLRDEHSDRTVQVEVLLESDGLGLSVCPSGYGCFGCQDGTAGPIYLEVHEGRLRLLIWADINQEDPPHVIDLEKAREDCRRPE
jgi:hypothetical protein